MESEESHHGGNAQTSLTETWNNRDPNPDTSTPNTDSRSSGDQTINSYNDPDSDSTTQKSKGVAISQGPQSVVNSDGVVLSYTRPQLTPIETWTNNATITQTHDDLFPTPSPTEPETESDTNPDNTSADSAKPRSPTTADKDTSRRTPLKPISSHAKRAAKQNRGGEETQTGSPAGTENNSGGVRVRTRPQKETTPDEENVESGHEHTIEKEDPDPTPTGREMVRQDCPECESPIVAESGDQFCSECGLLIADQNIDPGPEWRAFDHAQQTSRSRVGGPVKNNIHDKGLSTVIGNDNKDANGKPLSPAMRKKMARLRKWDSRFKVKNTKERNLRQAFGEIQRISSEMDLPEYVEETACTVYRRALDEELLPGRSIEAMASASVYIAMRQASIPKTLDHLISYCRVSESRITGAYSYLGRELGIEIKPPEVLEYLSRVASELTVSNRTERKAEDLLQTSVEQKLHSGKAPSGMAAAAVYAATMITRCDRVTQEDACKAGDVCELTIRTRHRELLEAYGIDHDDVSPPSQAEVKEARETIVDDDTDVEASPSTPEVSAD